MNDIDFDGMFNRAYELENLLRVLASAVEGLQISGKSFADSGGVVVLDIALDMAGDLCDQLLSAADENKSATSRDMANKRAVC